ncbi:MAG: SDR family NAD(P)-dependent oxidoreductase [Akkermansiaceae bacterium]|nr:SDR family NAD(P)-dependent oxidoreductase [Armatimonadota bacterium]
MPTNLHHLEGQVAVVTGATRGLGRAIAIELADAGATVYCTGRSVRGALMNPERPETLDETVEMIAERGGKGIAVRVDHTQAEEVRLFFQRVADEQGGRLDVLVSNVWGGDELTEWQTPFWEHSLDKGLRLLERGVNTHLIAAHYAAPLLLARKRGAVFFTHDGENGPIYYNLAKNAVKRMMQIMAEELRPHGVSALTFGSGFIRSEAVLSVFGVTNETWKTNPDLAGSETPYYSGRAMVALLASEGILARSGSGVSSGDLAREFGVRDVDGTQPHWGDHWEARVKGTMP